MQQLQSTTEAVRFVQPQDITTSPDFQFRQTGIIDWHVLDLAKLIRNIGDLDLRMGQGLRLLAVTLPDHRLLLNSRRIADFCFSGVLGVQRPTDNLVAQKAPQVSGDSLSEIVDA